MNRKLSPKLGYLGHIEKDLDYQEIRNCTTFHFKSVWGSSISRILKNEIHRFFPEFRLNKRKLYPKEKFGMIIDEYYMKFSKDAWDSICITGIVAFRYKTVMNGRTEHKVPIVVGGEAGIHYKLTTWYDPKSDEQKFTYYKLFSKRLGSFGGERPDKKVMILSNFGYNPRYDGSLISITSTLLGNEFFINRMRMYALRAEHNRSDPMIFAQTTKDSVGALDPSNMFGMYGDIDPNTRMEERRYQYNDAEIRETIRHNKKYIEAVVEETCRKESNTTPSTVDIDKLQIKDNFFPLPTGYTIVPHQLPESRGDWASMNKIYQEEIFTAYSIPRQVLMPEGSGKLMGNADMARKMMSKAINHWRTLLSRILTDIYCYMYEGEDCVMSLEDLDVFELGKMSGTDIVNFVRDSVVTISFPTEISIDFDQMVAQYSLGLLKWENLCSYTWRNSDYDMMDVGDKNDVPNDPWNQDAKLSMLQKSNTFKSISKTGTAGKTIFGYEEKKGETGKASDTKTPNDETTREKDETKKKKRESTDKDAPKKKRKKQE